MIQKAIGLFGAILTFLTSFTQAVFTPNVIRIDFDNIVDETSPAKSLIGNPLNIPLIRM